MADVNENGVVETPPVVKRGRGRPRTKPVVANIPGKKRGRSKKSETLFRAQGFKITRVHAATFDTALEKHANVNEGFNFVHDRFFKETTTNEYFYYKEGMLFATGISGNNPDFPVHMANLEEWKLTNLPKIDQLISQTDVPAPVAEPVNVDVPTETGIIESRLRVD